MIVPKNLESLSFKQITDLEQNLARAKAQRYAEAQEKLVSAQSQFAEKLRRMAAEYGVRPEDTPVIGNGGTNGKHRKPRKAKSKGVLVKYRDPNNAANTWSGRGRPARWLAALEKKGAKRESFLVV